jgi:hypothetical protein
LAAVSPAATLRSIDARNCVERVPDEGFTKQGRDDRGEKARYRGFSVSHLVGPRRPLAGGAGHMEDDPLVRNSQDDLAPALQRSERRPHAAVVLAEAGKGLGVDVDVAFLVEPDGVEPGASELGAASPVALERGGADAAGLVPDLDAAEEERSFQSSPYQASRPSGFMA